MAEGLPLPPAAVLPAKFKGRPHAYVQYLNGGLLPYHDRGESACPSAEMFTVGNASVRAEVFIVSMQHCKPLQYLNGFLTMTVVS